MSNRANILWQFFVISLVEEDRNGDTFHCHGSKTGHHRLQTINNVTSAKCIHEHSHSCMLTHTDSTAVSNLSQH